jgi:hypothetical protein
MKFDAERSELSWKSKNSLLPMLNKIIIIIRKKQTKLREQLTKLEHERVVTN